MKRCKTYQTSVAPPEGSRDRPIGMQQHISPDGGEIMVVEGGVSNVSYFLDHGVLHKGRGVWVVLMDLSAPPDAVCG
jgi:hypothetical protein